MERIGSLAGLLKKLLSVLKSWRAVPSSRYCRTTTCLIRGFPLVYGRSRLWAGPEMFGVSFSLSYAFIDFRMSRLLTCETSTPPPFSKQVGTFSSFGLLVWSSSALSSLDRCHSTKFYAMP
jgi:hypothetical protein